MVPMLNPDGAERYARRNAQAIDINRDALQLATPEGRLLKACATASSRSSASTCTTRTGARRWARPACSRRSRCSRWRATPQGTLTPGRARAKRVCSRGRAHARALRARRHRALRRGLEPARLRRQPHGLGHAGGADRERRPAAGRLARRPDAAQLRRAAERAPRPRAGRPGRRGRRALRGPRPQHRRPLRRRRSSRAAASSSRRAAEPYRADVAFDVLDDDPALAACPEPGPGRALADPRGGRRAAARPRRAGAASADRLLVPALAASVRGLDARSWLDGRGARRRQPPRRGARCAGTWRRRIARRRWRSRSASRLPAAPRSRSRTRQHAGYALEIPAPPARRRVARDARGGARALLTGGAWREPAGLRPLAERLGALAGAGRRRGRSLRPDARASLLVLRPRDGGGLDARLARDRGGLPRRARGRRSAVAPWRSSRDPRVPELGPNVQRAHGRSPPRSAAS